MRRVSDVQAVAIMHPQSWAPLSRYYEVPLKLSESLRVFAQRPKP